MLDYMTIRIPAQPAEWDRRPTEFSAGSQGTSGITNDTERLTTEIQATLSTQAKHGWRLHSVVPTIEGVMETIEVKSDTGPSRSPGVGGSRTSAVLLIFESEQ